MRDETIASRWYRTGQGDRAIPLGLAVLAMVSAPGVAWASGSFFWPWGFLGAGALVGAAGLLVHRWWNAREIVGSTGDALEFRRGRRVVSVDLGALTAVTVHPAAARTHVFVGTQRHTLSHRLVGCDQLVDHLRLVRPDLFPSGTDTVRLRVSPVSLGWQLGFAAAALGAGVVLGTWHWGLGLAFLVAGSYIMGAAFWFTPRWFELSPRGLTVGYWVRRRSWGVPVETSERSYAAGGAQFLRWILVYQKRNVALDEGQLRDPLWPWISEVRRRWMSG